MEATPGFEPGIKALQAHALPLGYIAAESILVVVPGAGLEPAQEKLPRDFKSLASTNFAIRATLFSFYNIMERETRFELATPTLARSCSTTELFPQNGRNFSKKNPLCQIVIRLIVSQFNFKGL